MTRIIAACNQKGGVGKSTSVCNIGCGLAIQGYRVLLIDMDPQAALTYMLAGEVKTSLTVYEVMTKQRYEVMPIAFDKGRRQVDLIPSNIELATAEVRLQSETGRDLLLQRALVMPWIKDYDIVLIDCPPSLGVLTVNALAAADGILIPIQSEGLSLIGVSQLLELFEVVKERLNPKLEVDGMFMTRFKRTKLAAEVQTALGEGYAAHLFTTVIHENVKVAEAPMHGKCIWDYDKMAQGALDYWDLVTELILGMSSQPGRLVPSKGPYAEE